MRGEQLKPACANESHADREEEWLNALIAENLEKVKVDGLMEGKYDHQFKIVFDAIKRLLEPPEKPKGKIGF